MQYIIRQMSVLVTGLSCLEMGRCARHLCTSQVEIPCSWWQGL